MQARGQHRDHRLLEQVVSARPDVLARLIAGALKAERNVQLPRTHMRDELVSAAFSHAQLELAP
jgi:hypothetical protein